MRKTINYYRKKTYGTVREYIADRADADLIKRITGKLNVDGVTRELLRDLTGGMVTFREVPDPSL